MVEYAPLIINETYLKSGHTVIDDCAEDTIIPSHPQELE